MTRLFLFASLFVLFTPITFGQIKTTQELISIIETAPASLETVLESYKMKFHTTTANVKIYKSDYQQIYITFNANNQIVEVLLRANAGYNLKSVEKSIPGDCKQVLKEKKKRIYESEKYQITFVVNDSKSEVSLVFK